VTGNDNHDKIVRLLTEHFGPQEFTRLTPDGHWRRGFCCPNRKECEVDERKQPIWTPRFGDENTDVMIVAEAPSNAGGPGLHVGGLLSECTEDAKSPLYKLRDFVKHEDNYRTIPYFTDLVKCGAASQEREDKRILERRAKKCVEALLLREIRIMKPRIILCVGALPYRYRKMYQSELKRIDASVEVRQLTHYGNQAGLHLHIDDKVKFIWECEAGLTRPEEVSLSKLSHFKSERPKR
jgi:uracil-DNA glycosylase